MKYLLDTCVVSDFFKKNPGVVQRMEMLSPKQIYISAISVMEVEFGLLLNLERANKLRSLWESLLKQIQVLPYSDDCALATATIRAYLKGTGNLIGPYDLLIAGSALSNQLMLVSSNLKEFKRVPNLVFEDWRS